MKVAKAARSDGSRKHAPLPRIYVVGYKLKHCPLACRVTSGYSYITNKGTKRKTIHCETTPDGFNGS